jgi:hypothetical protein
MSDSEEEKIEDVPNETEDIGGKVGRVVKRTACPFCDTDKWYVWSKLGEHDITGVVVSSAQASVSAYTFFCGRCGFVRQHVVSIVDGKDRLPGV